MSFLPHLIKRVVNPANPAIATQGTGRPGQPDFMCIGLPRSGTRWLYDTLQSEPDFWMPPIKELHFFDKRFRLERARMLHREFHSGWRKANKRRQKKNVRQFEAADASFLDHAITYDSECANFDWYLQLFRPKGRRISGDVTPSYCQLGEDRVAAITGRLPRLKVLLLLRDPVSRAWSGFNKRLRREIAGSGNAVLDREQETELARRSCLEELAAYIQSGEEVKPVTAPLAYERWRRHFDEDQMLVEFMDNISSQPDAARQRILTFLGGSGARRQNPERPASFNRKAAQSKVRMSDEIRSFLVEHFAEELRISAEIFGGPAKDWPRRYGL